MKRKKRKITIETMALRRLDEIRDPLTPNRILRFPLVYQRICSTLSMKKKETNIILRSMEEEGMIEIVRNHGIRIIRRSLVLASHRRANISTEDVPRPSRLSLTKPIERVNSINRR